MQQEKDSGIRRAKLGTILVHTEAVTSDQLDRAINLQKETNEGRVGEWLQRLGYLEDNLLTSALSRQYGLPWINLKHSIVTDEAVRMLPGLVARRARLIPVSYDKTQWALRVAASAPVDFFSQETIRRMLRLNVLTYIGDETTIHSLCDRFYGPEEADDLHAEEFHSQDDLRPMARDIVRMAMDQKADSIQLDHLDDCLWFRLTSERGHQDLFYIYRADLPVGNPEDAGPLDVASASNY